MLIAPAILNMKKKDWYENWFCSPYYRLLYCDRNEQEAEHFVETLVAHLQPAHGSRMLDIACGTGRYANQLAELGHHVTGIDLSYASILRAKEQDNDNLHFYVHDMRMPFYINYFDYAFNFFTSFGYFASDRDNVMAAKAFAKGLKPGGQLVVDYLNAPYVLDNMKAEDTVERGNITFHIQKRLSGKHIIKDIRFKDEHGGDRHFAERVAAFTKDDFISIFEQAGMKLEETYGDYSLGDYTPASSKRLIMIFKK